MRIRFLSDVTVRGRSFAAGDEAEYPGRGANNLIASGYACPAESEIAFASRAAAKLAEDEQLEPSDFAGIEASGETGYTVADVRAILEGGE